MLVTIGTPVQNWEIIVEETLLAEQGGPAKVPCRIRRAWGGGSVIISRTIAALGADVPISRPAVSSSPATQAAPTHFTMP